MALDPTFKVLLGEEKKIDHDKTEELYVSFFPPPNLGPILPFEHYNYDNYPQSFGPGGLIAANIDAVFNISSMWNYKQMRATEDVDGLLILDLTKGHKGLSEYFLWRTPKDNVVVDESVITSIFRKDINFDNRVEKVNLYDNLFGETDFDLVTKVRKLNTQFQVVGSVDPPTDLKDFIIKLCIALENSIPGTWIIFSLPNDGRIEFLEGPVYNELFTFKTIIRLVSSIYPWFVVQIATPIRLDARKIYQSLSEFPKVQNDESFTGLPLEKQYYDLKLSSMHWKIPHSG